MRVRADGAAANIGKEEEKLRTNNRVNQDGPSFLNPEMIHASVEESRPEYLPICPDLCELADGSLLIAYHRTSKVDFAGEYNSWSRVSSDGGRTWGEAHLVAENIQAPGLVRLQSGDLLLNGCQELNKKSTTMKLYRSKDGGKTWIEQSPIWRKSDGMRLQGGVGSLVQLSSGRILCPCHGSSATNYNSNFKAWCYYSDDEGKTWFESKEKVELPKRGAMEPSVAKLKNGILMMNLRTQLGSVYLSQSKDSGETWSLTRSSGLEAPEAPLVMAAFPDSDDLLVVYCSGKFETKHHHKGERTPIMAAISKDASKSWRKIGPIAGGNHEFGATGICFTSNGKAVIAYNWVRIPWDRPGQGGTRVAIIDKEWFYQK